jgi:hypothetical protein
MPVPLDEYPIHQVPLSMAYIGTSDRNAYDRCYFNAHDRTGDLFLVTGAGIYPNLGTKDAYAALRRGDTQTVVRCSDDLDNERLDLAIGPYRIEVVEPLRRVRLICDTPDFAFDLTYTGSFPAIDEERHLMRVAARPIVDSWRFAQLGTWEGALRVAGEDIAVTPDTWVGSRDRSWGIRPVGDPDPPGRQQSADFGFWWLYVPLRFDDFAIVVIAQEGPDGYRTLNDAVRVWPDGRVEQLGWPRAHIDYRPGTRHPVHATVSLTNPDGSPLVIDIEPSAFVPLHVGCGYGGDTEWLHGQSRGAGWVEHRSYDMTDPAIAARVPWGVVDHVAKATIDGAVGWGLFEHASIGRHDPSGFADLGSVTSI